MRILVKPLQIGKGARMFIIESTESRKECGMVDGAIKLQIHNCACRIDTQVDGYGACSPGPLELQMVVRTHGESTQTMNTEARQLCLASAHRPGANQIYDISGY